MLSITLLYRPCFTAIENGPSNKCFVNFPFQFSWEHSGCQKCYSSGFFFFFFFHPILTPPLPAPCRQDSNFDLLFHIYHFLNSFHFDCLRWSQDFAALKIRGITNSSFQATPSFAHPVIPKTKTPISHPSFSAHTTYLFTSYKHRSSFCLIYDYCFVFIDPLTLCIHIDLADGTSFFKVYPTLCSYYWIICVKHFDSSSLLHPLRNASITKYKNTKVLSTDLWCTLMLTLNFSLSMLLNLTALLPFSYIAIIISASYSSTFN